jgi:hypothetical protein
MENVSRNISDEGEVRRKLKTVEHQLKNGPIRRATPILMSNGALYYRIRRSTTGVSIERRQALHESLCMKEIKRLQKKLKAIQKKFIIPSSESLENAEQM